MSQHTQHTKPRIGITLGEPNGIGPEVVLKSLLDHRISEQFIPVLYGSGRAIAYYKKQLNIEEFNYTQVRQRGQYAPKQVNVVNCWDENLEINPGKISKETGKASLDALQKACEDLKENHLDALVTAPIDKQSIHSENFPFAGHTGFLTQYFGATQSLMLMVGEKLKVGLVTEHIPLQEVAASLTEEKILSKYRILEKSLKEDFGIVKPKIAILALNPHAGDNGLIGKEEEEILKPLVNKLKNENKLIAGPFPADGFFAAGQYAKFDAVLALYHDQGLIPFKSIAFEDGVNFTAGLSIIRTSPDHGTAYNIAGKNMANESSMRAAIYLAIDIWKKKQNQVVPQITH
ncbi:MAG: 4-hydroxythreonine-4-phosphate dehydrogenase PdxA [Cyclobacteriaceae bacterium]|nr:4-hydroxythreonine-4-phosphate dehydrogenase PdxA [Cyclobacteriaceae bacterium]